MFEHKKRPWRKWIVSSASRHQSYSPSCSTCLHFASNLNVLLLLTTLTLVLLCLAGTRAAPLSKHVQVGANNGKILIWPDEIDDNALTEHDGDFVYKQTVAEKQQTSETRSPSNAVIHWPLMLVPGKPKGKDRGIGRLSRNSAAAPAPGAAPGGSTVYLWPSFSPSSSSSSSASLCLRGCLWLLSPLNLCLMFTWLAWSHLCGWQHETISVHR